MQNLRPYVFWQFDAPYWFQKLNSSSQGLSQNNAEKILSQSSQFTKKPSHFQKDFLLFVSQFKSPLMLLLIGVITFLTLLYVLKVKEATFQTGLFIESIVTELFILFIIRTHKNLFKSKPANSLFVLSIIGLFLTISLPYLPFANNIGLVPLPLKYMATMLLIVLVYIMTADILKVWFFKKYKG